MTRSDELVPFEIRLALRGRWPALGAALFAAAAIGVTFLGLSTFRQLGFGAVTPAALGLLDLALLLPTLFALAAAAAALHGDGSAGLRSMLRASGVRARAIVAAAFVSVLVPVWLIVGAGFGASALLLAGTASGRDVAPFVVLLVAVLLTAATATAIGILVSALARDRLQALALSLGVWSLLALGVDLLLLVLSPLLRAGTAGLLAAAILDPLEAGRVAGLLILGADAQVLGAFGALLSTTVGAGPATLAVFGVQVLWIGLALTLAALVAERRDA